jgi:cytochrome c
LIGKELFHPGRHGTADAWKLARTAEAGCEWRAVSLNPLLTGAEKMKVTPLLAAAAAMSMFSFSAAAAPDADAAVKLQKESGCTKCHSVDKDKKGPAYQKVAAKYKGKADAEAKLTEFVTKSPKVKMDGAEEEHKAVASKDAAQVKNMVQWILAQ